MNQMIEALQGIMNQSQGETLEVPHPVDIPNTKTEALTNWHNSVLKPDREKDEDGDWKTDIVRARIVYISWLDQYNEPVGEKKLAIEHKYVHPVRTSKDTSINVLKPSEIRKFKERFPGAFQEFEMNLLRKREDFPLVLLDSVPPEVLQVLHTLGVRTIRQFAEYGENELAKLQEKLISHKMAARANYITEYWQRAKETVGDTAPARRGKAAA